MPQYNLTKCIRATHILGQQVAEKGSFDQHVENFDLLPSIDQFLQDHVRTPHFLYAHNQPYPLLQSSVSEAQNTRENI